MLRRNLAPYRQVLQVDLLELKALVQRGWTVSRSHTGALVTLEGSESKLLAVPATPSLLRQAIEQAQLRGLPLGADARSLLALSAADATEQI